MILNGKARRLFAPLKKKTEQLIDAGLGVITLIVCQEVQEASNDVFHLTSNI